jgi:predicted amidohydrolase YtcJ
MPCLKCAVTRKAYDGTDCGQSESINIETAIKLYTKGGAEAAGFRNVGMLKEGYSADFIILDRDIFGVDSEDIDKVKILKTYKEGICIFEA